MNREEKDKIQRERDERIKEIKCLYGLANLVGRPDISLGEICKGMTDLIPPAWQYSDLTCARIVFEGQEFKTDNFKITKWKQSVDINIFGKKCGTIEVYYLKERPELYEGPFLREERDLIEALAERLGRIIERKKTEEALRESEERYRILFEQAMDAIFLVDTQTGIILDCNMAAAELTGRGRSEMVGQHQRILHSPEDRDGGFSNSFIQHIAGEAAIETKLIRKSGEIRDIAIKANTFDLKGEKVILGVFRDITERKKSDNMLQANEERFRTLIDIKKTEAVKAALEERRRIDKIKDEFISTVSHELRTPMTSVREGVSQILEGMLGRINDKQRKFLSMALDDIDRLSRIVHNLLDISRIESGTVLLKKERSDIVSLARRAIASLDLSAKNKGLKLRGVYAEKKIEVYVDRDRIIEVFGNLVDNAVKFTQKGRIEISIQKKKGMVECFVSDTGKGIAKEDIKRTFMRFQQFGRTYGPGEKGTGLGLSIVASIIALHKGKIRVESKVNKGTKIIFTLPEYTPRELFRQYIDDGIKAASLTEEPLSILVYYIKKKMKIAGQKIVPIADKLYELITSSLRRNTDMVVRDTHAVLVMLPATKIGDACIIKERIEKPAEKYLSQKRLDKVIKIGCKATVFPDDGSSADELFDKIKEAVR